MKVFVAGATGRVAKYVIAGLAERGHEVICGSRHPETLTETNNIKPVLFDLHVSKNEMEKALKGCNAVYFLAGSRGKDLLQTDAFGAVKLMQAAENEKISRFIMLSSLFALEPEKWEVSESLKNITNYNIAKYFADYFLVHNSTLNYTILQPSVLKDEPGTGKIEINPDQDGANPIPDVASVLCGVLNLENTYHKIIKMRSGDTPIDVALANIH